MELEPRILGSHKSRRASPRRFTPNTANASPKPGKRNSHGRIEKYARLSEIICPHSACGGWTPRPRKPRPPIRSMTLPSPTEKITPIVGKIFGNTWRSRILTQDAPATSADSIYGLVSVPKVIPRAIRLIPGVVTKPIVKTRTCRSVPKTVITVSYTHLPLPTILLV